MGGFPTVFILIFALIQLEISLVKTKIHLNPLTEQQFHVNKNASILDRANFC